jgi:hypothetical protein
VFVGVAGGLEVASCSNRERRDETEAYVSRQLEFKLPQKRS